jgi:hypothetical protein
MGIEPDTQNDLELAAADAEIVAGGGSALRRRGKTRPRVRGVPADTGLVVKMPPLPAVADEDSPDTYDYDPYGSST